MDIIIAPMEDITGLTAAMVAMEGLMVATEAMEDTEDPMAAMDHHGLIEDRTREKNVLFYPCGPN